MWRHVPVPDATIAVAERAALGTDARVVVWPPDSLNAACAATDDVLTALDRQASRFRADSELTALHRTGGGLFALSDGLAEVIEVALAAANWTGGRVDPTVGTALIALGYDRDFAIIGASADPVVPVPVPGWEQVEQNDGLLRLPVDVRLDLGATAKGVGSDRAARAAALRAGGVLISLGGDIAVAGTPPRDGWPVTVDADAAHGTTAGHDTGGMTVIRLSAGAVATSSVTCRRWRRGGRDLHHIIDPRTGLPADGPWQTATVVAATCADANAAATATIVAGAEAEEWLTRTGLPARLVSHEGQVRLLGGWPSGDGTAVSVPCGSRVYPVGGPR